MTEPSSTAAGKNEYSGLIRALLVVAATTCILIVIWALSASISDPYVKATLKLNGSAGKGGQLFRMNCVGCHGITAQGLVGPTLKEVTSLRSDPQIINQIVKGSTPPMPSFEMEPQAMADLLAYLHSIN